MLTIAMGMLAWNEADELPHTLESVFAQSFFRRLEQLDVRVQMVVIPNGCTDNTAAIARQWFADQLPDGIHRDRLEIIVHEIDVADKCNAWNVFVHDVARPETDYFIFLDADIRLLEPDTLTNMLQLLRDDPFPLVATDTVVKHIALKEHPTLVERLLLAFGRMTAAAPGQLTGQLYCARADFIRRNWLPRGLIVEDGFLKVMAVTNMMTEVADDRRIQPAPEAAHMFEAYTRIPEIFRAQVRQAVGHVIYTWLADWLREQLERRPEADAGVVLVEAVAEDPGFFAKRIHAYCAKGGWLLPRTLWTFRWRRLWQQPGLRKFTYLPIAVVGFCFDLPVLLAANRRLHSGNLKGVWSPTATAAEDVS